MLSFLAPWVPGWDKLKFLLMPVDVSVAAGVSSRLAISSAKMLSVFSIQKATSSFTCTQGSLALSLGADSMPRQFLPSLVSLFLCTEGGNCGAAPHRPRLRRGHQHLWAAKLAGAGEVQPAAEGSITFSFLAWSSNCSSWGGLSRFGPMQMARLLQVILLVATSWLMCLSSVSSCLRRSRSAAGNFLTTLREQEGSIHQQAHVAHVHPEIAPGQPVAVMQLCRSSQPAGRARELPAGRMHGIVPQLLIYPNPLQGKGLCALSQPARVRCEKTQPLQEGVSFQVRARLPAVPAAELDAAVHAHPFS